MKKSVFALSFLALSAQTQAQIHTAPYLNGGVAILNVSMLKDVKSFKLDDSFLPVLGGTLLLVPITEEQVAIQTDNNLELYFTSKVDTAFSVVGAKVVTSNGKAKASPTQEENAWTQKVKAQKAQILSTVSEYTTGQCDVPSIAPLKIPLVVTSSFNPNRQIDGVTRPHKGVDFRASVGDEVLATASGKVVLSEDFLLPGQIIILDHGQGIFSLYMHLSDRKVQKGDIIQKGQVIGLAGKSGRSSASHLHYGVVIAKHFINPIYLLDDSVTWENKK